MTGRVARDRGVDKMLETDVSAFALRTDPNNWTRTIRFVNLLVRSGRRVLRVIDAASDGDVALIPVGSFVIPLSRRIDVGLTQSMEPASIRAEAEAADVELLPLRDFGDVFAAPIAAMRVGLYGGGGAPFNHAAILAECGFALRFLSDADILAGALATVDVLIMPGGGFRAMHGQLEPLGEEGCRAIADWVRGGGMYIGCCAGAYDCIVNSQDFVRTCPAQQQLQLLNAAPWPRAGAVQFLDLQSPGVGVVTVRNERPDHPVMFGMPPTMEIVHYNGPVLDPVNPGMVAGASAAVGLAVFMSSTDRFTAAEAFCGPHIVDSPTYLEQAIAAGRYSIMAGELGLGRVVAFGSHPEFGLGLPMHEWSTPAQMLANAVLWQASCLAAPAAARWSYAATPGTLGVPWGASIAAVNQITEDVVDRARRLAKRPIDPRPQWLSADYAMSVFGLPPDVIWRQSLTDIEALATQVMEQAANLSDMLAGLADDPRALSAPTIDAAMQIERWILDRRPAEWQQDGGYQGVIALLETAVRMCDEALSRWDTILGPPADPYAYIHSNPYHLVAGSYLAAIGCVVGAAQLMQALVAELSLARQLAAYDPVQGSTPAQN
jgi:biotin protein ligase-like protein